MSVLRHGDVMKRTLNYMSQSLWRLSMSLTLPEAQTPGNLPHLAWKVTVVLKEIRGPRGLLPPHPAQRKLGSDSQLRYQRTGVETGDTSNSGSVKRSMTPGKHRITREGSRGLNSPPCTSRLPPLNVLNTKLIATL